jgi:hypothetical protein
MLVILFKAIEWLIVLAVLFAFVIGAWRHTVEQTLGDPLLVEQAPKAKTKRYFTLLGKVLWHIVVPVAIIARIILEFMGDCAANTDKRTSSSGGDFRYKHKGETYYTHSTGDSSNNWY